jgi:hypothetical protein
MDDGCHSQSQHPTHPNNHNYNNHNNDDGSDSERDYAERQCGKASSCAGSIGIAVTESAALANDRRIHPKKVLNPHGEPRLEGSETVRLLRLDMDEGKHHMMKPSELY